MLSKNDVKEKLSNVIEGPFGAGPGPIMWKEFWDGNAWWKFATEWYVDTAVFDIKPCLVATTANLTATYSNGSSGIGATLTNAGTQAVFSVDGVTPALNSRILVKDQTNQIQNGVYALTNVGSASTNWVLTRTSDYDLNYRVLKGGMVGVASGTVNGASVWMQTGTITDIGTDNIVYVLISKSGSVQIVQGTANQINVSTVSGTATVSLVSNPVIPGNASITIPVGSTAQRPSTPTVGMERFNNGT